RASELQADAALARQKNAEAMGKIDASSASADQTDQKLAEMDGETAQARSEVEPLKGKPDQAEAEAQALDERAARADARTDAQADELMSLQADFLRQVAGDVPGAKTLSEQNQGEIQRTPDEAASSGGDGAAPAAFAPRGYEGRRKVGLPTFRIGPPLTEEQRQQRADAAAAAEARRRARIEALQNGSHGNFSELTAADKAGVALDFMLEDAFASASKIKWPDFSAGSVGKALLNIIDPRGPLNGILGGLSTVASGALNLFDMEQWQKDPLGNLLKSAADIATGITVILGSIVALLGVVIAICAAAILLSFGTLSVPLLGVIAWCTSAGATVGGWTISVGLLALYYQGLLIIKNIVDVMTAETAEELVVNTEQMQADFAQVGQVGMQMGAGYLSKAGGAGFADDLAQGGVRRVVGQEVREGLTGAAIEVGAGEDLAGVVGAVRMARGVRQNMRGGGGDGGAPRADADGGRAPAGEAAAPRAEAEGAPRAEESDVTPEAPNAGEAAAPPAAAGEATPPSAATRPAEGNPPPRPAEGPEPTPSVDAEPQPPRSEPDADATPRGEEGEAPAEAAGGPTQAPPEPRLGSSEEVPRPEVSADGPATPRAGGEEGAAPRPDEQAARPQDTEAEARTPRPDDAADPAALREAAGQKRLDEMTPAERRAEAEQANAAPREEIENQALREIGFDDVARLDNGMDYIRSSEHGAACRVANTGCGPTNGDGKVPEDGLTGDARLEGQVDEAVAQSGTQTPANEGQNPTDPPAGGVDPNAPSPAADAGGQGGASARPDEGEGSATTAPETGNQTATPAADQGRPDAGADSGATSGLPPRSDDLQADAKAMEGRAADAETIARMEDLGYTPVRNAQGEITSFRRPDGASSDLPAVTVRDGRVVDVAHRVPPPPGSQPIRVAPDGEHWIQNKDGTYRPVSEMADPARAGDDGRRHNPQLGRWGEAQADQHAASKGWEKVNGDPTHMDSDFTGPHRLDGVYRDPGPPERIIVGDAKVLDSPQSETQSGRQMSDDWIQDRVDTTDLPRDVRRRIRRGDYESVILRVDKKGNVTLEPLDSAGNQVTTPDGGGGSGGSEE
ncbi:MAG: hypothetical protein OEU92_27785, partial [Alphaproteobacteria bacterium]|nr:hypothetical protein [Alphaproteobacteria bacterium]